jgi:hypothetical protein
LPEEANDAKRLALSYANRMKEAHESLLLYWLEDAFIWRNTLWQLYQDNAPKRLQSTNTRDLDTYKQSFITGILRKESGAAITDTEFSRYDTQFFPQPWDVKATLDKKQKLREEAVAEMYRIAGDDSKWVPIVQYYNPAEVKSWIEWVKKQKEFTIGNDFSLAYPWADLLSTLK